MNQLLQTLTRLFPVWVVLCCLLALVHPPLFSWFRGQAIVIGLGVIMLGMGITLSVDDFRGVLMTPKPVALGFVAQYTIMPGLGWTFANLFRLPPDFAAGVILVACCPGGTASNVVAYIAQGSVALSVLMTMCSTFGAILLTPLLTSWLAGKMVPVDGWGLFQSTVQVVLLPVLAGLFLNRFSPRLVKTVLPIAPLVAVAIITLICASIIGQSAAAVKTSGAKLLGALFALHSGGFLLGYGFARIFGYNEIIRRTVAIEVGMQNSGLGVVLARQHFAPLTAVPCAISAVFHSVIGSLFAAWCRTHPPLPER